MNMRFKKLLLIVFLLMAVPAWAGVKFDLADDFLGCGASDTLLTENGALTISAWINPANAGENSLGRIIGRGASAAGVRLSTASTSTLRFDVTGSTSLARVSSNSSIVFNRWNHVLVTWDGSTTAANAHIYVNGTETGYQTTTNGATPTDNSAQTTRIGNSTDATRTFNGPIDELAEWNVVLTAQEIAQLSKSMVRRMPLQVRPASLKGYWPLDEVKDAGNADLATFRDLSSGGNTCTGDNGANNTGLTSTSGTMLSYP